MSNSNTGWRAPRPIVERIVVKADIVLQSAAHFGSGDVEPFSATDMLVLRDPLENKPLLPGASIAGALRNYLREWEAGYRKEAVKNSLATALFGGSKEEDDGEQSPLIVYDSIAGGDPKMELRDGVAIDPKTRTALDHKKFDLEVIAAGTRFPVTFELVVEKKTRDKLIKALVIALQGLETGNIHLGLRKNRGLGQVKIDNWQVWQFDLTAPEGLLNWLTIERSDLARDIRPQTGKNIEAILLQSVDLEPDQRHFFELNATFALNGALLIRSGFDLAANGPDTVHLQARQANGNPAPIIPGSSFAGVIRHRALRIAKTIFSDQEQAEALIREMFGKADEEETDNAKASRVRVRDTAIRETQSLVQNRIAIDRFTGGAHHAALFNEQPVFGGTNSELTLDLTLINPENEEIGLLLQVLKDLWVSDLPVGGSSSVGRGRLHGIRADLTLHKAGKNKEFWQIERSDNKLNISGTEQMETFAQTLTRKAEVQK